VTPPTVLAAEHGWRPRTGNGWWLDVVWRFENPEDRPLHVLAEGPLSMFIGDPLVINHTLSDQPEIDPNAPPDMDFVTVEPHGTLDLERSYPLPPVGPAHTVVGRFSASHAAPDPEWRHGRVWEAVERWQTVLESPPFEVAPPAS
jgi:hypothetical protein